MKKIFIFIFIFLVGTSSFADIFTNEFNYSSKETYHKLLAAIGKMEKDLSGLYIAENTEKKVSVMFLSENSSLIYADVFLEPLGPKTKVTIEFSTDTDEVTMIAENIYINIDPTYKKAVTETSVDPVLPVETVESITQLEVVPSVSAIVSSNNVSSVSINVNVVVTENLRLTTQNAGLSTDNIEPKRVVKIKRVDKLPTPEELYQKEYDAGYSAYMTKKYGKSYKHYKSALVYQDDDVAKIWAVKAGLKSFSIVKEVAARKVLYAEMTEILDNVDFSALSDSYKKGYKYLQGQLAISKLSLDPGKRDNSLLFNKEYKLGYSQYKAKNYKESFSHYKSAIKYKNDDVAKIWAVKSGVKLASSMKSVDQKRKVLSEISNLLSGIKKDSLPESYKKGYIYLKNQYNRLVDN